MTTEMGASVLVVEDDITIGDVLTATLPQHGLATRWVRNGAEALAAAQAGAFDLVLLDLGLPDLDGVEVCRRLRAQQPSCVLVMLTARTAEMEVVVGLEAGADDYLTKPFRLHELLARIRAHLRRAGQGTGKTPEVSLGDLRVDLVGRRVAIGGKRVELRNKEFDLLSRLVQDAGVAVSRERLMADVWDEHWHGPTRTLDVHVAALRRRLEPMDTSVRAPRITTLRGYGYRLDLPSTEGEP
ncbi:response regulator transcription factor [Actinomycetospora rhizophila]|uniref:Response regulator transcription factor n=1 Tax=Actinomycetospora rhizophila TaxID=1416876 RepID=A0ABV9Z6G2_9PSEU